MWFIMKQNALENKSFMFFQTNPTFTTDIKTSVENFQCEEKQ